MTRRAEQRSNPRLCLSYPIRVERADEANPAVLGRTVTQNVGARGAYFSTFEGASYHVGQDVRVVLSVPHRLEADGRDVILDLRGVGRVVRVEGPDAHGRYGEDGSTLSGVAVAFSGSLTFQYRWV